MNAGIVPYDPYDLSCTAIGGAWKHIAEKHVITRKTLLVFLALFGAGVIAILSGRMMGWGGDAQEDARMARQSGSLGDALGQAIGLSPAKPPVRRD